MPARVHGTPPTPTATRHGSARAHRGPLTAPEDPGAGGRLRPIWICAPAGTVISVECWALKYKDITDASVAWSLWPRYAPRAPPGAATRAAGPAPAHLRRPPEDK